MDQIRDANDALASRPDSTFDRSKPLQKMEIWADIRPFLITIPCVIALSSVLMFVICWKLYDEFAWKIYKHISADLRMKKRYLTFQVCTCAMTRKNLRLTLIRPVDFHRSPQVRFLLLCRLHHPVHRNRRRHEGIHRSGSRRSRLRILRNDCGSTSYYPVPHFGCMVHSQGKEVAYVWRYCVILRCARILHF